MDIDQDGKVRANDAILFLIESTGANFNLRGYKKQIQKDNSRTEKKIQ